MTSSRQIQVDIWQGDWGLGSIDLDCLMLMAYARFAGFEVEARKLNNPFRTVLGKLPVAKIGGDTYLKLEDLQLYCVENKICPDRELTEIQKADRLAYLTLMKDKLYPAFLYVWWVDERNCNSVTRKWYSKAIPFPFNFYYPNKFIKEAQELVASLFDEGVEPEDIGRTILGEAEKCLTSLSQRLGESDFMFGSKPTLLDAALYAYLAPILKAPFSSSPFQNYLKACPNLVKFITRVSNKFFPQYLKEYEAQQSEERAQSNATTDSEFPNKRRTQILAGLFAVVAMLSYALSNGILQANARVLSRLASRQVSRRPHQQLKSSSGDGDLMDQQLYDNEPYDEDEP